MTPQSSKKLLPITILDIMRRYTDENHFLSQQEIIHILKTEYDMSADRKTVKRNLMDLIDFGYPIAYAEIERGNSVICTDWHFEHSFSTSELRLIIDSLIFSKNVRNKQCKQLVKKLGGLSSKYFKNSLKHIYALSENNSDCKQLFYTIDVLSEAIETRKQVEFKYNSYGTDKKLHPRKNNEGRDWRYLINPYRLAAVNGRYYLICNYDQYDNISNYRVDRITDIKLLDTPAKPAPDKLSIEEYLNEHFYMFSGGSVTTRFKAEKIVLNDIIDWFGTDINISDADENHIIVTARVNQNAMYKWAIQYCEYVEVLEPVGLREKVMAALNISMERYKTYETK